MRPDFADAHDLMSRTLEHLGDDAGAQEHAEEANDLLRRGEVSGDELFAAYAAAIDERDSELHCYLHVCDDPGGDGIPIAIKDVIGTRGVPTSSVGSVPLWPSSTQKRWRERTATIALAIEDSLRPAALRKAT